MPIPPIPNSKAIENLMCQRGELMARVEVLEFHVRNLLRAEPDRHKEALSYEGAHRHGCIWCAARSALTPKN